MASHKARDSLQPHSRTIFIVGAPGRRESHSPAHRGLPLEGTSRRRVLALTWLTLLAVSVRYQDCARPKFLANPLTANRWRLTACSSMRVGVEFSEQHYEDTAFSNESGDCYGATRDHVKRSLCADQNQVIVLTPATYHMRVYWLNSAAPSREADRHLRRGCEAAHACAEIIGVAA